PAESHRPPAPGADGELGNRRPLARTALDRALGEEIGERVTEKLVVQRVEEGGRVHGAPSRSARSSHPFSHLTPGPLFGAGAIARTCNKSLQGHAMPWPFAKEGSPPARPGTVWRSGGRPPLRDSARVELVQETGTDA